MPSSNPRESFEQGINIIRPDTLVAWNEAINLALNAKVVGIDIETMGLDPLVKHIRSIQVAIPVGRDRIDVYVADVKVLGSAAIESMLPLLAESETIKVLQNAKFDLSFITKAIGKRINIDCIFDTMIASQIASAGLSTIVEEDANGKLKLEYPKHSLAELAKRHLGISLDKSCQVEDWSESLSEEMIRYAALDAAVLLPLYHIQQQLLEVNRLLEVAYLEFSCLPAVVEMELAGMPLNASYVRPLLAQITKEVEQLKLDLQVAVNDCLPRSRRWFEQFNPNSQKQILAVLAVLGHEVEDTQEEKLMDLGADGCQFAKDLLEYRSKSKKMQFLQEWLNAQHPIDDRIHYSLRQLNPQSTGRFSSFKPNIQQIPKDKELRRAFQAPPGKSFVSADYSAIEMRIMAKISGDTKMIQVFQKGQDPHQVTAAAISGRPISEINKRSLERQAAKAVNFGLIYGCGPQRLMHSARYSYGVEMSLAEAESAKHRYFQTYPGIKRFHQQHCRADKKFVRYVEQSWDDGWKAKTVVGTRSLSGRLRIWPNYEGVSIASFNALANTPVQGTGADIIKEAMCLLYKGLVEKNWCDVAMIATIHDEIILECPKDRAEEVLAFLCEGMKEAGKHFINPVPVEVEGMCAQTLADK